MLQLLHRSCKRVNSSFCYFHVYMILISVIIGNFNVQITLSLTGSMGGNRMDHLPPTISKIDAFCNNFTIKRWFFGRFFTKHEIFKSNGRFDSRFYIFSIRLVIQFNSIPEKLPKNHSSSKEITMYFFDSL